MILNGGISCLERHERWQKQTERNRCHIVTANGTQCLTVPVTVPQSHCTTDDVLISDHGNWQHLHWNALCSAYGTSPFFEFYADDIRPFFEGRWENLFDFNLDITTKMLHLIGITDTLVEEPQQQYYQTFQRRHGFIGGMSILDLLFNEGPEAIKYI